MINKSTITTYISILKTGVQYPISFLKQINSDNLKTLRRALMNESPQQIIKNVRKRLQHTSDITTVSFKYQVDSFIQKLEKNKTTTDSIIYISHEATLTGAPLIILNIAKTLLRDHRISPIQILCDSGEMEREFKQIGPTYSIKYFNNNEILKKEFTYLIDSIQACRSISAILVNSEGSTKLLKYLNKPNRNFKLISLIHEMGNYYPKHAWKHIDHNSDLTIFPSDYVKVKALENTKFSLSKIMVLGQGLMKKELLTGNKSEGKNILTKLLDIPSDSLIILGCGSLIPRKGIDLFILSAINFLKNYNRSNVHFLWLGSSPLNEYQIWAKRDIEHSKQGSHIHLIPQTKEIDKYFLGSDLFFLTSRGDPFPCVAHEALASGLPIIMYSNAGGTEEIISNDDNGFIVNFGDMAETNKILNSLVCNNDQRSRLSLNARIYAKNNLNFNNYCSDILTLINT